MRLLLYCTLPHTAFAPQPFFLFLFLHTHAHTRFLVRAGFERCVSVGFLSSFWPLDETCELTIVSFLGFFCGGDV
jgi:hypothetical protein